MKPIVNSIIPFPGFVAINLFGLIFVRKENWVNRSEERKAITLNHEAIHTAQQKELLFVFFYLIYFFEWIVRLFIKGSSAYSTISFEQEAYAHEKDLNYLKEERRHYNWITYWSKNLKKKH